MLLASVYNAYRHKYYNEFGIIFLVDAVLVALYLDNLALVAAKYEAPWIAAEDFIAKCKQGSVSRGLSGKGLKNTDQ